MEHGAVDESAGRVTRIILGCFEVPGWGGLATASYRLFETMLSDGLDVHYVSLVLAEDLARFKEILGADCENPRALPNTHVCYLHAALHEAHPELTALIESLDPQRTVAVGDIATYLMKRAAPERELVFLTAGCMQVSTSVPITEQLAAMQDAGIRATPDWKESEAVSMSDLILTHSPLIQYLYRRFYPAHSKKIHPTVFWFAEWIKREAEEYSSLALPFEERDIDALFVASSWSREEKNFTMTSAIAGQLKDLSIHIVGECGKPAGSATHHGFVGSRGDLFRLMGRARTVVCPSSFDAAPGILFEASVMACNVVTSKNCGNWELCNDGLLVTGYTADEFAKAILRARTAKLPDHMDLFLERSSYRSLKDVLARQPVDRATRDCAGRV
jgi:glycosyltransferase involved in cell wall biosynthesis